MNDFLDELCYFDIYNKPLEIEILMKNKYDLEEFMNKLKKDQNFEQIFYHLKNTYNYIISNNIIINNSKINIYIDFLLILIELILRDPFYKQGLENNKNLVKLITLIYLKIYIEFKNFDVEDKLLNFIKLYSIKFINFQFFIRFFDEVNSKIYKNFIIKIEDIYKQNKYIKNINNNFYDNFYNTISEKINNNSIYKKKLKFINNNEKLNFEKNIVKPIKECKYDNNIIIIDKFNSNSYPIYYFEIKILTEYYIELGYINDNEFEYNGSCNLKFNGNLVLQKKLYNKYFNSGINQNDYIGLCLNFLDNVIFFTKNGKNSYEIFPEVPINKNNNLIQIFIKFENKSSKFELNFGNFDFIFDINKYKCKIFKKYIEFISNINLNENFKNLTSKNFKNYNNIENKIENIINDYLIYYGYKDTYYEFNKLINKPNTKLKNEKILSYNIDIRKKIKENLKILNFKEVINLIENNFYIISNSINILEFYYFFYENIDNLNIFQIKEKIFLDKNSFYYQIYLLYKNEIDNINKLLLINDNKYKDYIKKYFSYEEMFNKINYYILKDNYGLDINEIERILKQLFLIIYKKFDSNPIIIKFLFENKNFLNEINKKLIENNISCEEIFLSKNLEDYFKQFNIKD